MTNEELEKKVALLSEQQSIQTDAIAALVAGNYTDGPESAKGKLVQLNPEKFGGLVARPKAP